MEIVNLPDPELYPFTSKYLPVPAGRLHYIDEGQGAPLVFVHGTPTWSFLWREQIKELSKHYRCVALDHIGFGLSDKPADFSYSLSAHRDNLERLMDHLQLKQVTLVVHDFGGPIGLGWAVRNPDRIAGRVILNSWMWPLTQEKRMQLASKFFSSKLGKFLYLSLNLSPRFLLPQAFHQKEKLTKAVHQQYLAPFQTKQERLGPWHFAKALAGETPYFENLYRQQQVLLEKPALIIWGVKDPLIPGSFLDKWQKTLPGAETVEVETGHFIQEEEPQRVTNAITSFLGTLR